MGSVILFSVLTLALSNPDHKHASVVCRSRTCSFSLGNKTNATATASFVNSINRTGLAKLVVRTSSAENNMDQAYAAGYVEAALSFSLIESHWLNFANSTFVSDEIRQRAVDFVTANDAYITNAISSNRTENAWWAHVSLVWEQLAGLIAGYQAHCNPGVCLLGRTEFLLLNALVDLSSIIHKPFDFIPEDGDWTEKSARLFTRSTTHCSALVKLTPDFGELWTAHNTWTGYFTMLRVMKDYDMPFQSTKDSLPTRARRVKFPGYPGMLASTDDFFVLDSGLVVQETTNAVYNATLLSTITASSVLTWTRSIVANRVSQNGKEWVAFFSLHNSGTINNQWMIVDYNLFTPYKSLKPGTLIILEQLPGLIVWADLTQTLDQSGYWPSYNRPWFPAVQNLSGATAMAARFGAYYSYDLYARAEIFRRDQGAARTRAEVKRLMRYNDYTRDPLSFDPKLRVQNPEWAIAARDDLLPDMSVGLDGLSQSGANSRNRGRTRQSDVAAAVAFGNTDAKLVSSADVLAMRFEVVVGPTHQSLPPFSWINASRSIAPGLHVAHIGHPSIFDFDWQFF